MADDAVARPRRPRKKPAKKAPAKAPAELAVPDPEPPREGEVIEPAYVAHHLRMRGMTWRQVAEQTGYANEVTACMAVSAYLQKAAVQMSKERAQEALQMELDFLDAMKNAWWEDGVVKRDEKAANVLLKISAQRTRLLEMFTEHHDAQVARTVVITGATNDYVAGLQRLVEADGD